MESWTCRRSQGKLISQGVESMGCYLAAPWRPRLCVPLSQLLHFIVFVSHDVHPSSSLLWVRVPVVRTYGGLVLGNFVGNTKQRQPNCLAIEQPSSKSMRLISSYWNVCTRVDEILRVNIDAHLINCDADERADGENRGQSTTTGNQGSSTEATAEIKELC